MLSEMLSQVCALQKAYGKTDDELEILVEGFDLALSAFNINDIKQALWKYIETQGDIPTPSDIRKIINEFKKYDSVELPDIEKLLQYKTKGIPLTPRQQAQLDVSGYAHKESDKFQQRKSFFCQGHAEKDHPNSAREILDSAAGQLALEKGIGRELLIEYEKTGRKHFDFAFVIKSENDWKEATKALIDCRRGNLQVANSLQGLYDVMSEREKRLYTQFYQPKQHAPIP